MTKYIVLYHAPFDAMVQMETSTQEEKAEGMAEWMKWAEKCGDQLIDMGAPLMNGLALSPDGLSTESDNKVAGYSFLQAENMEDAKGLLVGHPHLAWNAACSIEVHEVMPLPGS